MTNSALQDNPFKVFTPEDMNAADVHALFVDPFTDFSKIRDVGHTMVNGPRGCGKSMIFRYLLPDCQCLESERSLQELSFLAFLISIKNTGPNITEFRRLHDKNADIVLNEHILTVFVATKVFDAIGRFNLPADDASFKHAKSFFDNVFARRLAACGGDPPELDSQLASARDVFRFITDTCDSLYTQIVQYARRLQFPSISPVPYKTALCGYTDFLYPILKKLKELPFLPTGPIYLLIDDADYLNRTQTIALNSWVSTRTQADVSIKISTQLRYKTLATTSGLPIQSPHDYQAINIADIYTTRRGRYLNRVQEIIKRRLVNAGITATPQEFFPCDEEQEEVIRRIAERIRNEWEEKGRGHRPEDDSLRYARPEYIRSLGGESKSRSSYSYSGFEHLVHISSGLVRYFLEPAAVMFDEQQSRNPNSPVSHISPGIQNQIVRDEADSMMLSEFDRIRREEESEHVHDDEPEKRFDEVQSRMDRLYNLISSLGGTFFVKLISDDAERRVFSVAISGKPDPEVIEVFELGVRYGYFHRSSIGNKDGTGRTRLYVLTRRLAPFFTLDPTTFAGYLWVTNELLREAMANPDTVVRRMKKKGVSQSLETGQLSLFD